MGREIRRVPPDWEHPKYTADQIGADWQKDAYFPLYDEDYDTACERWYREAAAFEPHGETRWYHDWNGNPPDEESYRKQKWTPEEATAYQMYETVTEGTPVSPVFETKEALIDYLVEYGDFSDQKHGRGGWSRDAAAQFVEREWAPSFMMAVLSAGMELHAPRDGMPD